MSLNLSMFNSRSYRLNGYLSLCVPAGAEMHVADWLMTDRYTIIMSYDSLSGVVTAAVQLLREIERL